MSNFIFSTPRFRVLHRLLKLIPLSILFFSLHSTSYGQNPCPTLPGGFEFINFNSSTHQYFYPGLVPAGAPAASFPSHTAGVINMTNGNAGNATPARLKTIMPTLDGLTSGKVVLHIMALNLDATNTLNIYEGTNTSGLLRASITNLTQATFIGQSFTVSGPVTLQFSGSIGTDIYANHIRFITGDVTFTTCNNRDGAVWKNFIDANAYVTVDDLEPMVSGNFLPSCVAYFDENKNFVRSEVGFCLQRNRDASTPAYYFYPGETSYTFTAEEQYDIDGLNGYQAAVDPLKAARVLWLINASTSQSKTEWGDIQVAIWETLENGLAAAFLPGSWEQQAQAAVSTLPTPPEPDFDVKLAAGQVSLKPINQAIRIEVPFVLTQPLNAPQRVKMNFSRNVNVAVVSGGSLVGSTLTITGSPVVIDVTSSTVGPLNIKVLYDEPGYYNISNLMVFKSCNLSHQDFLHVGEENIAVPFRSLNLEWNNPLPVNLVSFEAKKEGQAVQLNWRTAEETNFSRFEIQRSQNSHEWKKIGTVDAKGAGFYHFNDLDQLMSTQYYRLKMVDLDGTFQNSMVKNVVFSSVQPALSVYPNPVADYLYFPEELRKVATNIRLYSLTGKTVFTTPGNSTLSRINVSSLSEGIYILKVEQTDGTVRTSTVVVKK